MTKAADKYLSRGGEPEARALPPMEESWDRVVVVPCRDEPLTRIETLQDVLTQMRGASLLIVVVNAPVGTAATKADGELASAAEKRGSLGPAQWGWLPSSGDVDALWIERCGADGIPPQEGVGRARKIGGDVALRLWRAGRVADGWIHFTDADARPSRALEDMRPYGDACAVVWPFEHGRHADSLITTAHLQHEVWMRWWVRGLERASSPFAYHTIGSCISARASAYADARGVPARAAGEDFHLLNKLAKLGPIARPDVAPVHIEARRSSRVPFGTGPAVARLSEDATSWKLTRVEIFDDLAAWLEVLSKYVAGQMSPWAHLTPGCRGRIESALSEIDGPGWPRRLEDLGVASQRWRRAHQWFDALRTLRFVHALERGRGDSPAPAAEVISSELPQGTPMREHEICGWLRQEERGHRRWVGTPGQGSARGT